LDQFILLQKQSYEINFGMKNNFIKNVYAKLVGDKDYIVKDIFDMLFINGIHLVTKLKKNIKGNLMSYADALMIRKRYNRNY